MFDKIRDRWAERRIRERFEPEFERAKKAHDQNAAIDRCIEEANQEYMLLSLTIQTRISKRLILEAEELDIAIPEGPTEPDINHLWQRGIHGNILSSQGRAELRKKIDEEKMRRRELHPWWWKTVVIPALSRGIGIIGAITGFVAVLKKH